MKENASWLWRCAGECIDCVVVRLPRGSIASWFDCVVVRLRRGSIVSWFDCVVDRLCRGWIASWFGCVMDRLRRGSVASWWAHSLLQPTTHSRDIFMAEEYLPLQKLIKQQEGYLLICTWTINSQYLLGNFLTDGYVDVHYQLINDEYLRIPLHLTTHTQLQQSN